jgi:alpha-tubulin suppressor-like RCC1 family protein
MSSQYKHIQLRRGKRNNFQSSNPLLLQGEPAFAVDSNEFKIGDGVTKWNDLPSFTSANVQTVTVNLPAMQANTSHVSTVTVESIDNRNEYAILCSPDSVLPDYVDIRHAYVSADKEVSIVFTNIDNSSVDGNATSNYSLANSSLKLHLVIYIANQFYETTTTTTTPDPVIDDVLSFGYNEFGQLSLGDKRDRTEPTLIFDNNEKWTSFDAGGYHSLAISKSGNLHSVGYNYYGQLGLGNHGVGTNRYNLEEVTATYFQDGEVYSSGYPTKQAWSKVSAGSHHSLAIDASGYLFSCGDGSYGALGLGPVSVVDDFTLVAGDYYMADLKRFTQSGFSNNIFTLNDLSNAQQYKFIADDGVYIVSGIPSGNPVTLVHNSTDEYISYSGGTLSSYTNGNNDYWWDYISIDVSGNYGSASLLASGNNYGANGRNLIYYTNPTDGWSDVSAGHHHSLGIKNSGLYTWGLNAFGQLGNGDHREANTPTKITNKNDWVKVCAGNNHSIALDSTGKAYSFGNNQYGQLGLGSTNHFHTPTEISFDFTQIDDQNFTFLSSGSYVDIQSYNNSSVYVFEHSENKQYNPLERFVLNSGLYRIYNVPSGSPIAILNKTKQDKITYNGTDSAGCLSLIGTTDDGTYEFYYGTVIINVLGDFDKISVYSYNDGYAGGKNLFFYSKPNYIITDIAAGANHTLLKTDTDQVLSFGRNHKGQLGTGDSIDRSSPFRISENNLQKIAAGSNHSLMLDSQYYMWSFGDNDHGQLGLGDKVDRDLPSQIRSSIKWQNIYAGGDHSLSTILSYYPNLIVNLQIKNANTNDLVGNRQLIAYWNHPTALVDAVTHYVIEYSVDNGINWVVHDQEALSANFSGVNPQIENLSYVLDGLDNTKNYLVRIAAVNQAGVSQYVSTSQPISPTEAVYVNFNNVLLYSHLDEGSPTVSGIVDLSNNRWPYTQNFVTNIDAEGTRYLKGKFSEGLRLYTYDGFAYNTNINLDGEFTVEFFWKARTPDGQVSNGELLSLKNANDTFLDINYNGDQYVGYQFNITQSGQAPLINTSNFMTPLAPEGFHHLALVRSSGSPDNPSAVDVVKLFIDGLPVASGRDAKAYDVQSVMLGSGVSFYDFDIDELRISSGVLYSSAFTPTTKPFGIGLS